MKRSELKAKTPLRAKTPIKKSAKPKKQTIPPITKLRRKADAEFAHYIRLRDAKLVGGVSWQAECISCPRTYTVRWYDEDNKRWRWGKQENAGHFVGRGNYFLRYDERNVNNQCLTAESKLRLFNGTTKSIADVKVGDELWAFNENSFALERAVVEQSSCFMPRELYAVEMENGDRFFATPDHRVVANGEWVYIKDMLHDASAYDILEL